MTIMETRTAIFSYASYLKRVKELLAAGKVTGDQQSPILLETTALNLKRMERVYEKQTFSEETLQTIDRLERHLNWVVLVEGWCADASQNIPILAKMASLSKHIDVNFILRDENPEIMNQYLTNGGKAIPKLVCYDAITGEELGTWGPRPTFIQQQVKQIKAANPAISKVEFHRLVQKMYAKDKGMSIQEDFTALMNEWNHNDL
jgi:hypothetical protein